MKNIFLIIFGVVAIVAVYFIFREGTMVFPESELVIKESQPKTVPAEPEPVQTDLLRDLSPVEIPEDNSGIIKSVMENKAVPINQSEIAFSTFSEPVIESLLTQPELKLPPINEEELMKAAVRIRCGKTYGSGFILDINGKKYAVTAAHVAFDQIDFFKNYQCDVIFPRKDENGNFRETYYRVGKILLPEETVFNYKEKGIDLAILEVLPLENRAEDESVFPAGYPFINYSFCPADTLNDQILLWGYSANLGTAITPGAFLSKFTGEVVQYEDVSGTIKKQSNEFVGGYVYLPRIEHSLDTSVFHHLTVVVSSNNFSGASGGLVFNVVKRCVIGVNIATLIQDNKIFGFVTNPRFGPIKDFIDKSVAGN